MMMIDYDRLSLLDCRSVVKSLITNDGRGQQHHGHAQWQPSVCTL